MTQRAMLLQLLAAVTLFAGMSAFSQEHPAAATPHDAAPAATGASVAGAAAEATYSVEPHLSLGEIALKLYGRFSAWKKIAEWNGLSEPFRLQPGQKLALREKPTFSAEEGDQKLVRMWLRRFAIREGALPEEAAAKAPDETSEQKRTREEFKKAYAEVRLEEEKEAPKAALDAASLLKEGEAHFKEKRFEDALARFRESKRLDSKPLVTWFYEIRTLRLMQNEDEARTVAERFVKIHPELRDIPLFQSLLQQGKKP